MFKWFNICLISSFKIKARALKIKLFECKARALNMKFF